MCQDRSSGLALSDAYREIDLPNDEIIGRSAKMKKKMFGFQKFNTIIVDC